MTTVTWLHDEMLSPDWLADGQPAVFVFDEAWLREECVSLKRVVFMYECLLDLPGVEVWKGDVVAEVRRFAQAHGAERVVSGRSPLPRIRRQGEALGVEWLEPEPIVTLPDEVDLKRFSRYWRRAEKQVIRPL